MTALRFLTLLVAALVAAPLVAQPAKPATSDTYEPQPGQAGKDVIWLPTPDAMVAQMLRAAKVTSADLVYDLGSGDGKIPIAAAKTFGAKAIGIEYNPDLAAFARRNVERAGVADRATIITGDIFKEDFSKATVVTLYLLPDLNLQLRPTLLKMKPGTRIVSHQFHMGEWQADETFKVEERDGYLWIVPADVAGRWTLKESDGAWEAQVDITQKFQRIAGTMTRKGVTQPLLGTTINGSQLAFTFVDTDGAVRTLTAKVDGNTLDGRLGFVTYGTPINGVRLRP
jgi:SAM-dependent methyltransferase